MAEALATCPHCLLQQKLPATRRGCLLRCARCATRLRDASELHAARQRVRAFSLAALLLFPAAVLLPVMRLERLGYSHEAGILRGGLDLLFGGELLLGLLVLICSVALPLAKLTGLLVISSPNWLSHRHAAFVHRLVEITGRFGMLDVLLVALLAALVKLGDLVEITAGPGVLAFAACTAFSLLAAASFDPRSIWTTELRS